MRNMGGLLRGICLGWGLTVTTWTGAEATEHFVFGLTANQSCDVYQGSTLIQQGVPSSSEGGLTFSATGSGTFQVVSTGTFVDTTPPGTIGNLATGTATSSSIQLSWTSTGDDGGTGQAQVYDLRYATSPITDANWASATQATGEPLPKPTGQNETFTVTGLTAATTYYFAVKAGDEVPNFGPLSNVASGATSGGGDTTPPTAVSNLATGSPSASSISLSWTATGDDGASGKATTYDLRYATSPINAGNFASATQVSGEPAPKTSGSSETFTVTGLAAGTTYYFALKVADEVPNWSGISNVPSGTTTNPDVTAPAAVTNLATGTLTATSIQLNWTAVGDDGTSGKATTYDLRYSTSTITTANWGTATQVTGEPAPKTSGSAETFTVTGLASNTKYYFALKVADEVPNVSGLSNVPSATTLIPPDQTAPSAVTNLAVASSSSSSISLTWTATGDDGHTGTASVYDLRYSNQPITTTSSWNAATQATNEPTPKANGQSEAFTVPGLNSGTTYYFALKVGDEVPNWSGLSNSPSGLTPAGGDLTPPSNITDLAVAGTSSSSVTLRWTAVRDDGMSGNCTRYDMRYGDVPILTNDDYSDANYAPNEPVPVTPGQQQTMTISGLAPGHTYYFAVRAADEVFNWSQISNSPGGTTQGGADVTAPTAVTTLAVTTSTQNTMTVTWSAVGDDGLVGRATTYDLRYSTSSITSGNWANATKATGEPTPGLPGTAESFVLSGLSPNQTYYLALKVGDEVPNWSGLSNLPSGTTESGGDVVPPAQINNLAVSERQFDRLRVNWTATGDDGNEGVSDHFELRRSLSPITGSNWGSATPVAGLPAPGPQGTQHSVWSFGLNPNTRYYYAIKAFDEAGNASAISNVPSGITLDEPDGDPPIKVNDLEAMVIHTDAVELRWTAPHDTLHVTQRVHTYELRVHTAPVTEGGSGYRLVTGPNPSAPGQAEQFTLSGLLPNSQYYLRVRSCDEAGNWSRLSNQLMMTTEDGPPPDADETAPAAVADLDATSAGPDYVDLSWLATGDDGAVGTATSYDLRHATFPITTVTWDLATAVPGEPTPRIAGSHETMRVDGLSVGVMHYFALRVSDEAGNTSLLSNVVQQATPRPDDIAPPFSVFDLAVVDSTETSLSLHWTTPADSITPWAEGSGEIAEYQVRRSETPIDESNWVDATLLSPPEPGPAGTPASYAATGLEPGRVYYFALKSIDPSGNESALSNLAVGATKVIPPPPPDTMSPGSVQDLLFEPLDPQRAVLRWVATGDDGNEGRATEYRLRRIVGDEGITLDDEDLVWQFGDSIPIDLEPKAAG
ncbi:MAG: fibronectin type III domain-containing protein [Candidatus Eisenbacteria bacterium]|nr:fibronectin type III domain-containing protein [Candidatus Eisenbacteria bacterium]